MTLPEKGYLTSVPQNNIYEKTSVIITCPIYFHYFCAFKILQHDYSFKPFDSIRQKTAVYRR